MADRRKKGCPNPDCKMFEKKKFNSSEQFCGQCGTPLVYVCASRNCFKKLEDRGPKHTRCERCDAARNENIAIVKEKANNALKSTVGSIPTTAAVAGKKIMNKEQAAVVESMTKAGESVVDAVKGGAVKAAKKVVRKK